MNKMYISRRNSVLQSIMLSLVLVLLTLSELTWGHGMMLEPPQRSSMWRFPKRFPNSPRNYDDNGLYCGGFKRQWEKNGGQCGICGDAFDDPDPRPHELGGRFARGIVVATYSPGQLVNVTVDITANHRGYFLFKLCPSHSQGREVTQSCLDAHVLGVVDENGSLKERHYIDSTTGMKYVKLQLPDDITCTHCVLQWTYNAGNSWGCDRKTRECCVGCGPQENFVNCADIAITTTSDTTSKTSHVPEPLSKSHTSEATDSPTSSLLSTLKRGEASSTVVANTKAPTTTREQPTVKPSVRGGLRCQGAGLYRDSPGMEKWCLMNCAQGYCPSSHCLCL